MFDAMPVLSNKQHWHMLWRAWQAQVLSSVCGLFDFRSCSLEPKAANTLSRLFRPEGVREVTRLDAEIVDCLLLLASGLFDQEFYVASNSDVPSSGLDPVKHYRAHGGIEGRAPSPNFDGALYLSAYPDISKAGANPLLHFIKWGAQEGRLDAVRLDQPPTGVNRSCYFGDKLNGASNAMTQMTTVLQEAVVSEADPTLIELRHCLRFAWENLHKNFSEFLRELEQFQLNLYNKNIDFERSVSLNDRVMNELAAVNDRFRRAIERAKSADRELEIIQRKLAVLSEDLGEANQEIVYWRRKALGAE